jgi:hypothetical protein
VVADVKRTDGKGYQPRLHDLRHAMARDYERLASTLAAYHWLAFTTLMLQGPSSQNVHDRL